jgi:hypothetical protein
MPFTFEILKFIKSGGSIMNRLEAALRYWDFKKEHPELFKRG